MSVQRWFVILVLLLAASCQRHYYYCPQEGESNGGVPEPVCIPCPPPRSQPKPQTMARVKARDSLTLKNLRELSDSCVSNEEILNDLTMTDSQFLLTPQLANQLDTWEIRPEIVEHLLKEQSWR